MKNTRISMRTTLLILTVPLVVALIISIASFSAEMSNVANKSKTFITTIFTPSAPT